MFAMFRRSATPSLVSLSSLSSWDPLLPAAAVGEASSGGGGVSHNVAKSTMALFLPTSVETISMGDIIMMVPMGVELQPLVRSKESHGRHRPP